MKINFYSAGLTYLVFHYRIIISKVQSCIKHFRKVFQ